MSKLCLITGATCGIGESFARHFAQQGFDLIITGRRRQKLEAVADSLSTTYNVKVETVVAELGDASDRQSLMDLASQRDNLEVLINNAGFGSRNPYPNGDLEIFRKMVAVHVLAPIELIDSVTAKMSKNGSGIIINVSSLAGLAPYPFSSIYCGTKAFLIRFSESLHMRLRDRGVRIQVLCPGLTKTDFHHKLGIADSKRRNRAFVRWMSADAVVRSSLHCLSKNKVLCIPGFWNKLLYFLASAVPRRAYFRILSRAAVKRAAREKSL